MAFQLSLFYGWKKLVGVGSEVLSLPSSTMVKRASLQQKPMSNSLDTCGHSAEWCHSSFASYADLDKN